LLDEQKAKLLVYCLLWVEGDLQLRACVWREKSALPAKSSCRHRIHEVKNSATAANLEWLQVRLDEIAMPQAAQLEGHIDVDSLAQKSHLARRDEALSVGRPRTQIQRLSCTEGFRGSDQRRKKWNLPRINR